MPYTSRFLAAFRDLRKHVSKTKSAKITARDVRPIKPRLPSLAQLPDELISRIVELVGEVSPESLYDICMVCSCQYEKASAVRY
jgi:hypothetical protein